jgi:hypothetical protein
MIAMVHARASRAHAKAGDLRASQRAEDAAFTAHDRAGHPEDEPACVYWVSQGVMRSANLFQRGSVSGLPYCLAA